MRCLIIHNPASGPSSDEIYAFTHALAQGGDEVVMRFIGDGMEPRTPWQTCASLIAWSFRAATAPSPTCSIRCADAVSPRSSSPPVRPACSSTTSAMPLRRRRSPRLPCRSHGQSRHGRALLARRGRQREAPRLYRHRRLGLRRRDHDEGRSHQNDIGEIAYFLSALATPNPTVAHLRLSMTALSRSSTASAAWPATPRSSKTTSTCSPTAA